MKKEKDFNTDLREQLELMEWNKTIEWFERLNSGKVRTLYGTWIQLCRPFTPDWIVLYHDRNKHLAVLFIEGKSDTGMFVKKEGQDKFMEKYNLILGFKVIKTNVVKTIVDFLNKDSYSIKKTEIILDNWEKPTESFLCHGCKSLFQDTTVRKGIMLKVRKR